MYSASAYSRANIHIQVLKLKAQKTLLTQAAGCTPRLRPHAGAPPGYCENLHRSSAYQGSCRLCHLVTAQIQAGQVMGEASGSLVATALHSGPWGRSRTFPWPAG